jgi:hypothetical protein
VKVCEKGCLHYSGKTRKTFRKVNEKDCVFYNLYITLIFECLALFINSDVKYELLQCARYVVVV